MECHLPWPDSASSTGSISVSPPSTPVIFKKDDVMLSIGKIWPAKFDGKILHMAFYDKEVDVMLAVWVCHGRAWRHTMTWGWLGPEIVVDATALATEWFLPVATSGPSRSWLQAAPYSFLLNRLIWGRRSLSSQVIGINWTKRLHRLGIHK